VADPRVRDRLGDAVVEDRIDSAPLEFFTNAHGDDARRRATRLSEEHLQPSEGEKPAAESSDDLIHVGKSQREADRPSFLLDEDAPRRDEHHLHLRRHEIELRARVIGTNPQLRDHASA
jgi:hypothetical protein